MESIDRNETPLPEPKPKSKRQSDDALWSKCHGPSRVRIDDMSIDVWEKEQIAEEWERE